MTSGWPSPSRSTTAGEEYQPVPQEGPAPHPPYCHFSTGALTWVEPANPAVTGVLGFRVTAHVPVPEQPAPLQPVKLEPPAGLAVKVTDVPLL